MAADKDSSVKMLHKLPKISQSGKRAGSTQREPWDDRFWLDHPPYSIASSSNTTSGKLMNPASSGYSLRYRQHSHGPKVKTGKVTSEFRGLLMEELSKAWEEHQIPAYFQETFRAHLETLTVSKSAKIIAKELKDLQGKKSPVQQALQAVDLREKSVAQLKEMDKYLATISSPDQFQDIAASCAEMLHSHRMLTLMAVEKIVEWRSSLAEHFYNTHHRSYDKVKRIPFMVENDNYLVKMRNDNDFMKGSAYSKMFLISSFVDPFLLQSIKPVHNQFTSKIKTVKTRKQSVVTELPTVVLHRIRMAEHVLLEEMLSTKRPSRNPTKSVTISSNVSLDASLISHQGYRSSNSVEPRVEVDLVVPSLAFEIREAKIRETCLEVILDIAIEEALEACFKTSLGEAVNEVGRQMVELEASREGAPIKERIIRGKGTTPTSSNKQPSSISSRIEEKPKAVEIKPRELPKLPETPKPTATPQVIATPKAIATPKPNSDDTQRNLAAASPSQALKGPLVAPHPPSKQRSAPPSKVDDAVSTMIAETVLMSTVDDQLFIVVEETISELSQESRRSTPDSLKDVGVYDDLSKSLEPESASDDLEVSNVAHSANLKHSSSDQESSSGLGPTEGTAPSIEPKFGVLETDSKVSEAKRKAEDLQAIEQAEKASAALREAENQAALTQLSEGMLGLILPELLIEVVSAHLSQELAVSQQTTGDFLETLITSEIAQVATVALHEEVSCSLASLICNELERSVIEEVCRALVESTFEESKTNARESEATKLQNEAKEANLSVAPLIYSKLEEEAIEELCQLLANEAAETAHTENQRQKLEELKLQEAKRLDSSLVPEMYGMLEANFIEEVCKQLTHAALEEAKMQGLQHASAMKRLNDDLVHTLYDELFNEWLESSWLTTLAESVISDQRGAMQPYTLSISDLHAPQQAEAPVDFVRESFTPRIHSPNAYSIASEHDPQAFTDAQYTALDESMTYDWPFEFAPDGLAFTSKDLNFVPISVNEQAIDSVLSSYFIRLPKELEAVVTSPQSLIDNVQAGCDSSLHWVVAKNFIIGLVVTTNDPHNEDLLNILHFSTSEFSWYNPVLSSALSWLWAEQSCDEVRISIDSPQDRDDKPDLKLKSKLAELGFTWKAVAEGSQDIRVGLRRPTDAPKKRTERRGLAFVYLTAIIATRSGADIEDLPDELATIGNRINIVAGLLSISEECEPNGLPFKRRMQRDLVEILDIACATGKANYNEVEVKQTHKPDGLLETIAKSEGTFKFLASVSVCHSRSSVKYSYIKINSVSPR